VLFFLYLELQSTKELYKALSCICHYLFKDYS
jgi:hypothetical protein